MSQENDIQSCRRLLNEIAEMCENASLTGSLSGGANRTAQRYNTVLKHLIGGGSVPEGLFSPIPENAEFGEIGVEARMLAGYFPSNKEKHRSREEDGDRNILIRLAPFVGKEELGLLIREQAGKGQPLDMKTISNLAPFLGQEILGQLIRTHLNSEAPKPADAPTPKPAAPAPAPAAEKPDYRLETVSTEKQSVNDLLNLLKSPYLSDEERNELVEKIRVATGQ
jgi:hypothetical protein